MNVTLSCPQEDQPADVFTPGMFEGGPAPTLPAAASSNCSPYIIPPTSRVPFWLAATGAAPQMEVGLATACGEACVVTTAADVIACCCAAVQSKQMSTSWERETTYGRPGRASCYVCCARVGPAGGCDRGWQRAVHMGRVRPSPLQDPPQRYCRCQLRLLPPLSRGKLDMRWPCKAPQQRGSGSLSVVCGSRP